MSPRAACRLLTLGFTQVYDYVVGKLDWLARNQPVEGTSAHTATIGSHLRHDVLTAGPNESISDVRARVAQSRYRFALVTTTDAILLGRLRSGVLDTAHDTAGGENAVRPVGELMEAGPSTLRPHEPAAAIKNRLQDKALAYAIVTDPDGRLLGTVHPSDL